MAGYKINTHKSAVFPYINNKVTEKFKKTTTTPFAIAQEKNKILRNKLNQEGERPIL